MAKNKIILSPNLYKFKYMPGGYTIYIDPTSPLFSKLISDPKNEIILNFKDSFDKREKFRKESSISKLNDYTLFWKEDVNADFTFNQDELSDTIFSINFTNQAIPKNLLEKRTFNFNGAFGGITLTQGSYFNNININNNNLSYTGTPTTTPYGLRNPTCRFFNDSVENINIKNIFKRLYIDYIKCNNLKKLNFENIPEVNISDLNLPNLKELNLKNVKKLNINLYGWFSSLDFDLSYPLFSDKYVKNLINTDLGNLAIKINLNSKIKLNSNMEIEWNYLPYNKDSKPVWKYYQIFNTKPNEDIEITPIELFKKLYEKKKQLVNNQINLFDSKFLEVKNKFEPTNTNNENFIDKQHKQKILIIPELYYMNKSNNKYSLEYKSLEYKDNNLPTAVKKLFDMQNIVVSLNFNDKKDKRQKSSKSYYPATFNLDSIFQTSNPKCDFEFNQQADSLTKFNVLCGQDLYSYTPNSSPKTSLPKLNNTFIFNGNWDRFISSLNFPFKNLILNYNNTVSSTNIYDSWSGHKIVRINKEHNLENIEINDNRNSLEVELRCENLKNLAIQAKKLSLNIDDFRCPNLEKIDVSKSKDIKLNFGDSFLECLDFNFYKSSPTSKINQMLHNLPLLKNLIGNNCEIIFSKDTLINWPFLKYNKEYDNKNIAKIQDIFPDKLKDDKVTIHFFDLIEYVYKNNNTNAIENFNKTTKIIENTIKQKEIELKPISLSATTPIKK